MNLKELENEIRIWFNNNEFDNHKWSRGVGKLIKQRLTKLGYWKNLPRFNPAKGKRKQEEFYAKQNGWRPEEEENQNRDNY